MSNKDSEIKSNEPVTQNVEQFLIKYCRESLKKDFAKFSAFVAVIFSMGLWAIKSMWYAYMSGKFYVYKIDRCYINASNENVFLQIIQLGAILIILFIVNYVFYRISVTEDKSKLHWKKIKNVLLFWMGEMVFFGGISLFVSPIEFHKEAGGTTWGEILSLVGMLILLCFLTNIYAIVFLIEHWWKRKNNKQETNSETKDKTKDKAKDKTEDEVRGKIEKELGAIILTIIVTFSVEMLFVFASAIRTEYNRNNYKVILTQCEENVESDYIIEYGGNRYEMYPIAYENEDCYIVTRLFNQNRKNKMDYTYQKVIPKEGQETRYFDNIYNMRLSN